MKMEIGTIWMTPAIAELVSGNVIDLPTLVRRHAAGDWGVATAIDQRHNARALKSNIGLVISTYPINPRQPQKFFRNVLCLVTDLEKGGETRVVLPLELASEPDRDILFTVGV